MRRSLARIVVVSCLIEGLWAQSPFSGSYPLLDEDVIGYQSTPPNDAIALLQRRLEQGAAKLQFQDRQGYLLSVLEQLKIPLSSQTLVFSKTSSQQHLISPATPRALYFNDNIYVGWVNGGEVLEIAAVDPSQGTMFYTLDQRQAAQPRFVRREECLQCHATPKTIGVPGLLLRSVFTISDGTPLLLAESFYTDQSSPMAQRWGGWYVTGTHGSQRHMGNALLQANQSPEQLDREGGANLTSLEKRLDVNAYAAPHSDLVALMVLAHQTHVHNLISRVNWETRITLHRQEMENKAQGVATGARSDATVRHIHDSVDVLLRSMLFADEARLEAPVTGTSGFAREFASTGVRDKSGRSLKDLDLKHRMFRYPCSFLIYSEAFDALPRPALEYFYQRLWEILTAKDQNDGFRALSRSDRQAILSILRQTKSGLPAYWRDQRRGS